MVYCCPVKFVAVRVSQRGIKLEAIYFYWAEGFFIRVIEIEVCFSIDRVCF